MYEFQIFFTILMFLMKIQNYDYVRIIKDNYYLVDFNLTKTILFSTFLLMSHYFQILNSGLCINCNITRMLIFICQSLLYMIEYDIKVVN